MGLIKCKIHGYSSFIQMSNVLFEKYYLNKKEKYVVLRIVFSIKKLDTEFAHYDLEDNRIRYESVKSFEDFELVFEEISGDKGTCGKCFKEFVESNKIELDELVLVIENDQ
ncbi:conserved protein of unknown function [Tenacibaculum sp. 190130A14a]|uniref:Uncharacterized protein n=1 Tax=Tenacibaculum polynesiense TaxID=3137857 RepID=A0ABM9P930_9FLAO